jgi:hypothetical protein
LSKHVSLRIALLDKQIVDADQRPFGRVDDLELELLQGRPRVVALLTGAEALGERLGGRVGGWMAGSAALLRPRSAPVGPPRIDPTMVRALEPMVALNVPLRELRGVAGLERWLAHHVVEPVPGAGDARE